jgi:hypothetical protein
MNPESFNPKIPLSRREPFRHAGRDPRRARCRAGSWRRAAALVAVCSILPISAQAGVLHDWPFDEPSGTQSSAVSDVAGGSAFSVDLGGNSWTTGTGLFRFIRGGANTNWFTYAEIKDAPSTGKLWLVVDLAHWNLTTNPPRIRIGLANHIEPETTSGVEAITAEIDFRPGDTGLGGYARGPGWTEATHYVPHDGAWGLAASSQNAPVRFVLEYDQDNHSYEIFYSFDLVNYVSVGAAQTSPQRAAKYIRLGGVNTFSGTGFDFDRIFLSTTPVIPQPSGQGTLIELSDSSNQHRGAVAANGASL